MFIKFKICIHIFNFYYKKKKKGKKEITNKKKTFNIYIFIINYLMNTIT